MNLARTLALCMLACAGCAHLPDGTLTYYLAQTSVRFKVVRTVACDKAGKLLSSSAVTYAVTHGADTSREIRIPYAELRNDFFADSDVKVDFYPDGRLQNVNGTFTGQGEQIFKTLTSIVSTAAVQRNFITKAEPSEPDACTYIATVAGGPGKSITLNYEGDVDPSAYLGAEQDIPADSLSDAYASNLGGLGDVCAVIEQVQRPPAPFKGAKPRDGVVFVARQPALVQFTVRTGDEAGACTDVVWSGTIPVAQLGTEYELPLQRAPVFGTQKFVLSLQESGALESLQYATTSGTAGALNVLDNALTTARTQAQKETQAINDEINLMLAQQHLVKCRADPSSC